MKITIITATKNSQEFIKDCVESVSNQSYKNIEHIFIDSLSGDSTLSIIQSTGDHNKLIISESDSGIYNALNKGIKNSSGDIIGFLHSDDFYADHNVLSSIADAFNDPTVSAVYGDLQYVNRSNKNSIHRLWKSCIFSKSKLMWGWMPPHPTLYVRKNWVCRVNGFDDQFKISSDYDFILKLFTNSDFKAIYLNRPIVLMRTGGISNRSLRNILLKSKEDIIIMKKFNLNYLFSFLYKNLSKINQFLYFF